MIGINSGNTSEANRTREAPKPTTPESSEARSSKPTPGSTIRGEVVDRQRDKIVVRLNNGEEITGKSVGEQSSKIGEMQEFKVSYDEKGQLELRSSDRVLTKHQEQAIKDLMLSMGLKGDAEELRGLKLLLENRQELNRGIDKQLLIDYKRAMRLQGGESEAGAQDKALFLLKNELKIGTKTLQQLNDLIGGSKITESLAKVIKGLEDLMPGNTAKAVAESAKEGVANGTNVKEGVAKDSVAKDSVAKEGVIREGVAKEGAAKEAVAKEAAAKEGLAKEGLAKEAVAKEAAAKEGLAKEAVTKEGAGIIKEGSTAKGAADSGDAKAAGARTGDAGNASNVLNQAKGEALVDGTKNIQQRQGAVQDLEGLSKTERLLKGALIENAIDQDTSPENIISQIKENLIGKLKSAANFEPRNATTKDLEEFYNKLIETIDTAKAELSKAGLSNEQTGKLQNELTQLKDNLEFSNNLRNPVYVQIPIQMNQDKEVAELYVFKDKKSKNKQGASTALIGIDTQHMGRFEVYLQRDKRQINCQFRLADETVERRVRSHIHELGSLLREYDYTLGSYTFKRGTQRFTLIDNSPGEEDNTGQAVFDMRT